MISHPLVLPLACRIIVRTYTSPNPLQNQPIWAHVDFNIPSISRTALVYELWLAPERIHDAISSPQPQRGLGHQCHEPHSIIILVPERLGHALKLVATAVLDPMLRGQVESRASHLGGHGSLLAWFSSLLAPSLLNCRHADCHWVQETALWVGRCLWFHDLSLCYDWCRYTFSSRALFWRHFLNATSAELEAPVS